MFTTIIALAAPLLTSTSAPPTNGTANGPANGTGLVAIRVGRAETISNGTIENAVILIDGDKIATVGEDLIVERGIRVIDRPDWVAMPGLVDAYSRFGLDSDARGGSDSTPEVTSERELYPRERAYGDLVEAGVTTLALYPPGTGIPGQALVIRPVGDTRDEMILDRGAYLKIHFRSNARSKKLIRDGFESVDKYHEKEKKEREKYDKEAEKRAKKKKSSKSKKDEDEDKKDEDEPKKEEEDLGPFVPPEPDPDVVPFMELRDGALGALVGISDAGDYLHLLDAIGEEEFEWGLRVPVTRELNLFEISDKLGESEVRIVMEPQHSLHPGTMRQRNLPAELVNAGAKLVFIPRDDNLDSFESWLRDVGEIVATGLDRDVALRAVTLEPAILLGLEERLGSLDEGKDANLILLNGDPLEVGTKIEAVMLDGRFVYGEVQ